MRLTKKELKEKYYPEWNDTRHDIVRVCYGDDPLIVWDNNEYTRYSKLSDTLANIEAINAYMYTQYGSYNIYRTLIGEICISNSALKEVLCGNIHIGRGGQGYDITLNMMYGNIGLTIMKHGILNSVGFRTKDGIHSVRLLKNTKELKREQILSILNVDLSDYGLSIHKFMEACRKVYYSYPDNYILENCFGS